MVYIQRTKTTTWARSEMTSFLIFKYYFFLMFGNEKYFLHQGNQSFHVLCLQHSTLLPTLVGRQECFGAGQLMQVFLQSSFLLLLADLLGEILVSTFNSL